MKALDAIFFHHKYTQGICFFVGTFIGILFVFAMIERKPWGVNVTKAPFSAFVVLSCFVLLTGIPTDSLVVSGFSHLHLTLKRFGLLLALTVFHWSKKGEFWSNKVEIVMGDGF